MNIHFTSPDRPKRFVKALRKTLLDRGHDIPFAKLQEAAGVMFGYRGWNDLLGQQGKAPASRPDHELDLAVLGLRYSIFAERLSQAAGVSIVVAKSALRSTRPTAKRQIPAAADWAAVFDRMAQTLTARALSVEPFSADGMDGFYVSLKATRSTEAFRLVVAEDGSRAFVGTRGGHLGPYLGQTLHKYGLGRPKDGSGVADPLIAATIGRLSPAALSLLVTSSTFSSATYEFAHRLPQGAPIRGLVARYPLIGSQIALHNWGKSIAGDHADLRLANLHLAMAYGHPVPVFSDEVVGSYQLDPNIDHGKAARDLVFGLLLKDADSVSMPPLPSVGEEIAFYQLDPAVDQGKAARELGFELRLNSASKTVKNPVAADAAVDAAFERYLDIVEFEIATHWHRKSPSREAIARTVHAVGHIYIPGGPVFRNQDLGLLALCPEALLPSSPESLTSALRILTLWGKTYTGAKTADLDALFVDLEERFGGDWHGLDAAVTALRGFSVSDAVSQIVAKKLAVEGGVDPDAAHSSKDFTKWVLDALFDALFQGRSVLAIKEAYARLSNEINRPHALELPLEDKQLLAGRDYDVLVRSGVMPDRLRFDRAGDLMNALGEDWQPALERACLTFEAKGSRPKA